MTTLRLKLFEGPGDNFVELNANAIKSVKIDRADPDIMKPSRYKVVIETEYHEFWIDDLDEPTKKMIISWADKMTKKKGS